MITNDDKGTRFGEVLVQQLAVLENQRDHAEIIGLYESNRAELDVIGGSFAAMILRHAAAAYASLGDYPLALRTARLAQATAAEDGDGLVLAEIFLTVGSILRDMGELKEAEKTFRDAESIFRRNDCPEGQSRALNKLAGLFFRVNDYRNSLAVLMEAVEIARKLDDKPKLAYMMGNIGRVCTFLGSFDEAERHLKINAELSHELSDELEAARAELSLGYLYIQQGEYSKAEAALAEAYPAIISLKSRRDEVIYYTYLGELRYRAGRYEESHDSLERALAMAEAIGSESTLAGRVMRHLAELGARTGDSRQARRMVNRAMVIMTKSADKAETGALWKLLGVLAQHEGSAEEAQKCFKTSLEMLSDSGVRFEKADALLAAGCSRALAPRERLTYLFRAEEFFASHGAVNRVLEVNRLISELDRPETVPAIDAPPRHGVTGDYDYLTACPAIRQFKQQLMVLGRSDLPLLLTGETGVGKDHLARYFHSMVCPQGPYVAINCASLPETLLESELFGYRRGAFTGADSHKQGLFLVANGGVLLLDEIGDLPLSLQAKLLGVIERRRLVPLGGTTEVNLDVKLVAATNRDLTAMVEAGTFRRDLYYRLGGITFHLPPLRERKEDIPLLMHHFFMKRRLLAKDERLPAELVRQFVEYDWPGNIRELDNKVRRLEIMTHLVAEGNLVELSRAQFEPEKLPLRGTLFDRLEQFERRLILEALLTARGNKSEAARLLGVHEATVRMKLKRYGIGLAENAPN